MGSVVGTMKEVVDKVKGVGVLKIRTYRPFPEEAILNILKKHLLVKMFSVVRRAGFEPATFSLKGSCSTS